MKKYWTHHQGKPQNDVSNIFIIDFKQSDFYKSPKDLANKGLLACLFDSNCHCYCHSYHGVVTCADETHHLYVKVPAALSGVMKKQVFSTKNRIYSMSELHHIDVFLDTL